MPAPGDQHRAPTTTVNPFEETKPHVSEYTAQEIATLQSRLEKQLGPEYISSRPGAAGQKVHYLAAEKCINLANEVFGFNGWSSAIQQVQIDFVDESQTTGKISLGLSVIVRVSLRDGTFHEDIGYGHIENCKGKAAAFEKAKKEGTTDALKRALRNFGNVLGNCIYDKDYLAKVTKVKVTPSRWDIDNLHRHPDFVTIKKEEETTELESNGFTNPSSHAEGEDEFGGDEFDEVDFNESHSGLVGNPDEVVLEPSASSEHLRHRQRASWEVNPPSLPKPAPQAMQQQRPSVVRGQSIPGPPNQQNGAPPPHANQTGRSAPQSGNNPQTPTNVRTSSNIIPQSRMAPPHGSITGPQRPQHATVVATQNMPNLQHGRQGQPSAPNPPNNTTIAQQPKISAQPTPQPLAPHLQPPPTAQNDQRDAQAPSAPAVPLSHEPPIGFFTARAAESLQNPNAVLQDVPTFNPHLESPSIRKTIGVDHTKSKPVNREVVGAPPPPPANLNTPTAPPANRSNFVNPQMDASRRIGMPGAAASPLQNRNSYKPPQMKRPAESNVVPQQQQHPRPPLGDVSTNQLTTPSDVGGDIKRPRLSTS
ncbi:MAG: hypothetical protein M1812_005625 [Candelaria pacifica]|nr:MAG: hypothetical protein M1812_005625 [Candelaria pacifica]